jgi:hypothetical protein
MGHAFLLASLLGLIAFAFAGAAILARILLIISTTLARCGWRS